MTQSPAPVAEREIPSNLYKPTAPLPAVVLENRRLTHPDSPNDVRHIVLDLKAQCTGVPYQYLEGQSLGVLPPGTDANGRAHKLRLYSIASPALGDNGQGTTASLCVKRAITVDAETGAVYKGVCSNYLCDLAPGDVVQATGPVGKGFLMPEVPNANLIMIATGTGIAPYRAFLYERYHVRPNDSGEAWLFFGVQTKQDYLYAEELEAYRSRPGYHLVTAFSREEKNADGSRMYVQHRLAEHGAALIERLQDPATYVYICGLKGMETGILAGLTQAAAAQNLNWESLYGQLQQEKRWRVEVY